MYVKRQVGPDGAVSTLDVRDFGSTAPGDSIESSGLAAPRPKEAFLSLGPLNKIKSKIIFMLRSMDDDARGASSRPI